MKTSHSCPEKKRGCEPKPSMLINEISKLFHDKMRENSEKLGFKTHSAVHKRIRKIGLAYEKFSGEDFGFSQKKII